MRVLLVEDDGLIACGILAGLRAHGLTADTVSTAAQAEVALSCWHCDALILDLGLPDEDGMHLLRRLRHAGNNVPVLILTARDAIEEKVAGLHAGADDYLLKPFDLSELVARLHALLRRAAGRSVDIIEHGPLQLNPVNGEVHLHGEIVALSRRERALLAALLQACGRILSAQQLKDSLYQFDEPVESNALNVHLHHLRRKLGVDLIETIRGVGYRMAMGQP